MKKIYLIILFGLLFVGCGNKKDITKILANKIDNNYHIEGLLEIVNNENTYKYDIDVSYQKKDNFRVSLKNKANEHEQIILKNKTGVYVLTPSLNKSFKFQSEWPYNNSQSYLIQNIVEDINNDNKKKVIKKDNLYIITTTVNYPNNKELTHQNIYVKPDGTITKVEVLNNKDIIKIKMTYNKIDYKAKFTNDYFDLDNNMITDKTTIAKDKLEDSVYPMYVPENTYLEGEEKVALENGERVILTFAGEEPFTIIEQTISNDSSLEQVDGDVELLNDVLGYINDDMASWVSNGVEYYAISETMAQDELLKVVNSISVLPVGK